MLFCFLIDSGAIDYEEFLLLMAKILNDADTQEDLVEVLRDESLYVGEGSMDTQIYHSVLLFYHK